MKYFYEYLSLKFTLKVAPSVLSMKRRGEMKQYQAQTQSQMRKWTMKSPLFDTKGEAREWIINKRTICQMNSLKVKRKVA